MKKNKSILIFLVFGLAMVVISCKKDPVAPTLTTNGVSNITINSVTTGGEITNGGGADVTERGVCWGTSSGPSISGSHTTDGKGVGSFISNLTGLTPNTLYHIRAYATNEAGTAYGNDISFTTTQIVVPTLTTTEVTSITLTTAVSGGNISTDGGGAVSARGVCWSTTENPTLSDSTTTDGTGTGSFVSTITGLLPETIYHVRAYATNSSGTAYGNDVTFTTSAPVVPTLTTNSITSITQTTAVSGGDILSDGGGTVTGRGICWATTENPTISNFLTSEGSGLGSFISNLTGLLPGTTYYVRAYAVNSAGTAYGNEFSFTTLVALPTLTTTAATSITQTTAVSGGNISDAGGASITARGTCWSTTANPTTANSKTSDATGIGTFVSNLTGLLPGTTYHIRAYATNSAGTSYGSDLTFTTLVALPTLTTTAVTSITQISAVSGGDITSAGGGIISARGVCWALSANPTIANSITSNGTGIGSYPSNLTGLTSGTVYHVRAYATNSAGTAYGNDRSFTTLPASLATLTTTAISSIGLTTATSGGNITSDGNGSITARGVCWSTTPGPDITDPKTSNSTGTGSFTSNITGLSQGTTYYVRAYATNIAGTAYGNEISFSTKLADVDGNTYNVVKIGTQVWMAENLKTTKYSNGDVIGTTIPTTLDISAEIAPKYQWAYNGDDNLAITYGRLYTWFVATDSRNVCPAGWHVPDDPDWHVLEILLGDEAVAGGKLKETGTTHWQAPNTGATNETGFTSLPGGYRSILGEYADIGVISYHWSTTLDLGFPGFAWGQEMVHNSITFDSHSWKVNDGISVRCVKD